MRTSNLVTQELRLFCFALFVSGFVIEIKSMDVLPLGCIVGTPLTPILLVVLRQGLALELTREIFWPRPPK